MDSKGNIKLFDNEEQRIAEGYNTALSEQEAEDLMKLPEHERHRELAFSRFWAGQFRFPTDKTKMKFAFMAGFEAAKEIEKQERPK